MWPGAAFAAFAIIYGGVFACLVGYVAARLAPRNPLVQAVVVAGLLFGAATGSYFIQQSGASLWSLVSTVLVSVPVAMFGGYLCHRSMPQKRPNQSAVRAEPTSRRCVLFRARRCAGSDRSRSTR